MASQELINIIIKAVDEASATAEKVDESLHKIGDSSKRLGNIPGFDAMKSKLSSVASTLDGKLGGSITKAVNHFNNLKNRVGNVASSIKGKMGGALDGIRNKLSSFGKGAGSAASSLSMLKGAASMTVGMIGYDLVNSIVQTTKASLNARASIQQFGSRLRMSASEVNTFQKSLDELQSTYKKVDMDVVGQTAMDMAYRLQLPKSSLTELTETTAIFTDAMARNGRTSEDAMLAMADAMDGQFRRLQEIGLSEEALMRNGWSGDLQDKEGLLKAMNKALKEQHYDILAKSVDSLDDAWQVLSITMGNLLESILLPITPAIVGVINGFLSAIEMIKSAWNGLPDWGKIAIGIGALAIALGILVPALLAVDAASLPLVGTLYAIAGAVTAISWPIVAVVAAVALLGVAIYEVGKAFGWWHDVGSMLEAIGAGLQRMWSAFINHPDVQAVLTAISGALQVLWSWIVQAWNAILEFFGVSTNGDFDIVHAIIVAIGQAWEAMTFPIRVVIGLVEWLVAGFQSMSNTVSDVWNNIMEVIGPILSAITTYIYSVINAFNSFRNGQITLPQLIMSVLTAMWTAYVTILSYISNLMLSFASRMLGSAMAAGRNTVNGLINTVRSLPSRFRSILMTVVSVIVSAGAAWISSAVSQASSLVSNVASNLASLPGRISSALSGVVNAIVQPFKNAYDNVVGVVDSIKSKVQEGLSAISSLGSARGGDRPMGGDTAPVGSTSYYVSAGNDTLEVNENINLTLDLKNVPVGIDERVLIEALTDKNVVNAFVSNPVFQDVDARVKQSINLKNRRHYGV